MTYLDLTYPQVILVCVPVTAAQIGTVSCHGSQSGEQKQRQIKILLIN